jgi:hypothetical protein
MRWNGGCRLNRSQFGIMMGKWVTTCLWRQTGTAGREAKNETPSRIIECLVSRSSNGILAFQSHVERVSRNLPRKPEA